MATKRETATEAHKTAICLRNRIVLAYKAELAAYKAIEGYGKAVTRTRKVCEAYQKAKKKQRKKQGESE